MSFQLPTTVATTGFSFGLSTATPTAGSAAKPGFNSMGGGDAASAIKPITFGSPTSAPLATTTTTGSTLFTGTSIPAASVAPTPKPTFSFGTPASAPAAATTTTTTTTSAPNSLLGNLAKTTATALNLTTPATQAQPTTTATVGLGGSGFANLSTATKTTDSASVATTSQLSYNQLEEHINKWTMELEEQEKMFTDQATQINAWDKVLMCNNQKILELNEAVQKVKSDQVTLEQELDFISSQQKELEESLQPLQKDFQSIPAADVERSVTYMLVENLDTQLKQMAEDLKEIIDNLNESNKGQDNTDPIIQIGKILNAHMSSLQWIEASSTNMCNKLEDISKMHENFKRESERSFRSAYN